MPSIIVEDLVLFFQNLLLLIVYSLMLFDLLIEEILLTLMSPLNSFCVSTRRALKLEFMVLDHLVVIAVD